MRSPTEKSKQSFISIDFKSNKLTNRRSRTSNRNRKDNNYECEGLFCEEKVRKGIPVRRIGLHMHQLIQKCEFDDQYKDRIDIPKDKFICNNEFNQLNLEFLTNENKYFFVSNKEHLKLKRPVTRYDFCAITHNKDNGLPKFKSSGRQIQLIKEEHEKDKKKTMFVCADCYSLYSDFYIYFKHQLEKDFSSH